VEICSSTWISPDGDASRKTKRPPGKSRRWSLSRPMTKSRRHCPHENNGCTIWHAAFA